jgi:long-chain acyl-CoA synthetase
LPFLHVGELFVRGAQIMRGYLDSAETEAIITTDGWLKTGDLAELDEDGYFHILGLCSSVYWTADGVAIYPRDIEEVLIEWPELNDVAVIGHGGDLTACIQLVDQGQISAEELRDFCRERLPENHVPSVIRFVEQLPRNYAGRLLVDELQLQLSALDS